MTRKYVFRIKDVLLVIQNDKLKEAMLNTKLNFPLKDFNCLKIDNENVIMNVTTLFQGITLKYGIHWNEELNQPYRRAFKTLILKADLKKIVEVEINRFELCNYEEHDLEYFKRGFELFLQKKAPFYEEENEND